mgnify:FL=1
MLPKFNKIGENIQSSSQNSQIPCYMRIMKNIFVLSISLVALSAGAGLGLSALHQSTVPSQASVLSTPLIETGANGFVIPTYVPDATQSVAALETLTTPDLESDNVVFDTPSTATAIPSTPAIEVATPDVPNVESEEPFVSPKAIVRATPNRKPASVVTRAAITMPRIVLQPAVQERAAEATNSLKYVVGVYR